MRYALLAFILLTLGGWGALSLGGGVPAAGGGPTITTQFDDGFASDTTGWSEIANEDCTHTGSSISMTNKGVCFYDGAQVEGSQVTTSDSWVTMIDSDAGNANHGPGLRHSGSDHSNSQYHYVVRFDNTLGLAKIRVCDGDQDDGDCADIESLGDIVTGSRQNGDMLSMAIVGQSTSTEFAVWFFPAGSMPTDECDPDTWGTATYCVSDDGTIADSKLTTPCSGATTSGWDTAPDSARGYPNSAQVEAFVYNGDTSTRIVDRICAGNY